MGEYIITNGELHNTDELKHWKYVKKERVNGRWRYYYDDGNSTSSLTSIQGRTHLDATIKTPTTKTQTNTIGNLKDVYTFTDKNGYQYTKIGGEDSYGEYKARGQEWITTVARGSSWFTSSSTLISDLGNGKTSKRTTIKVGKIAQAVQKAKKWISKLFSKK